MLSKLYNYTLNKKDISFINEPINITTNSENSENNENSENFTEYNSSNILKVNTTKYKTNNYKIINYDKKMLNNDNIATYGLCRSVIANEENTIVCYSPPKSLPYDVFINKYPEKKQHIIAQEFVEGTMINVFFNKIPQIWEIATKNTIGGFSYFYKSANAKTFNEMFFESASNNMLNIDSLDQNKCYSFVLQHPNNRIVAPFNYPQLYLIAIYSIDNTNNKVLIKNYNIYETENNQEFSTTTVKLPKIYELDSDEATVNTCESHDVDSLGDTKSHTGESQTSGQTIVDLNDYNKFIDIYASVNTEYEVSGFVLYNEHTYERTRIRNPVYEEVKKLRGNQAKLQYQYLLLRKQGKVRDFLKFYPEHKEECSQFRNQIHIFTNTLYKNYISCYIKKEKPLIDFSKQYRTHMYRLHNKFLYEFKEYKKVVNNNVVIEYVNNLTPSLLMHSLNLELRKQNTDFSIS